MSQSFHDRLSSGLQHRRQPPDNRQQQQDNGTSEFQPPVQQGGDWGGRGADVPPTLSAHLERSRSRGELPRLRPRLRLAGN